MQRLDLNRTQLPASKFPDFADAYVCDKCGTDITEHVGIFAAVECTGGNTGLA